MLNLRDEIIAIDICNTIANISEELNIRLGRNPDPNVYFHPGLVDKPNFFEDNLDIFLNAKPIGNSVEVLKQLSIHNHIMYITARPKIAEFVTRVWLKKNGYPLSKIYFTNDKVEIASNLGITLAIDDAPFEIERYINAGFKVLVKKQSYNSDFNNRFEWDDINYWRVVRSEKVEKSTRRE